MHRCRNGMKWGGGGGGGCQSPLPLVSMISIAKNSKAPQLLLGGLLEPPPHHKTLSYANHGNCATEFDGCGQYLWVCPVGVAMVPDGNPKKLEPM